MAQVDKINMSLDDIIKLNKNSVNKGPNKKARVNSNSRMHIFDMNRKMNNQENKPTLDVNMSLDNIIKMNKTKTPKRRMPIKGAAQHRPFKQQVDNRPRKFPVRQQPLSNKPFGMMNKSKAIQTNRNQNRKPNALGMKRNGGGFNFNNKQQGGGRPQFNNRFLDR